MWCGNEGARWREVQADLSPDPDLPAPGHTPPVHPSLLEAPRGALGWDTRYNHVPFHWESYA